MKKILQFTYGLGSGGIEAFVTNLNQCRTVFQVPFDFLLYTSTEQNDFYEKDNLALGSNVYKLGDDCSPIFVVACIQKRIKTYWFLKKHHYDIVHIHNSTVFCILEAVAAKLAGAEKIVIHSHNTALGGSGAKKAVKAVVQKLARPFWPLVADEFCACSTEAGIWMYGPHMVEKGKVHVLKNGIIGKNYYYNENVRQIYRGKLGWDDNYIIGHVGRFSKQKNHVFLISIFEEIHLIEPKARLILFGIGELQEEIRQLVIAKKLEEYVDFYGVSKEINCWLQAIDLFLFPSLYEGLPVSGIEAQAAGVPIVASDTISPELEITNCIEWMSLTQSAKEWAECSVKAMKKSHQFTEKSIIDAGYDIENTAGKIAELYQISEV